MPDGDEVASGERAGRVERLERVGALLESCVRTPSARAGRGEACVEYIHIPIRPSVTTAWLSAPASPWSGMSNDHASRTRGPRRAASLAVVKMRSMIGSHVSLSGAARTTHIRMHSCEHVAEE